MAAEKRAPPLGDKRGDSKRVRSNNEPVAPPTNGALATSRPSIQEQIAAAKARAQVVRERLQVPNASAPAPAQTPAAVAAAPSPAEAARARVEALKARVQAATAGSQRPAYPLNALSAPPPSEDGVSRARGGLGIGLHPALLGDMTQEVWHKSKGSGTVKSQQKHQSSFRQDPDTKSKKQLYDIAPPAADDGKNNPYYDARLSGATVAARGRRNRELIFHQKGKYIAQAAALRRQAQLEEMKRRIANSVKAAGLDEDRSEQAFIMPKPPEVEWWDEGLLVGDTYPTFDADMATVDKLLKIGTDDSIITRYVQHPVLLEPPQEKVQPAPKPLYMTKEETAKLRRQNRMAALKEKQAKVRLGLEPPEPTKYKISNMMGALGEQAVKDPTAIEARVNREIAERREKHEQANQDRALTKEQRNEKLANQQDMDAGKGIQICVFRIDSLAFGKHRYKIDVNAKQHALTGMAIYNPKLSLVIVEGGPFSIRKYKKLMLERTDWTEIAPMSEETVEKERKYNKEVAEANFLKPEDEDGTLKDLSANRCVLVWEGEEKQRTFKKWGPRVCETESSVRSALERFKMENMWMLAKNWAD